MESVADPVAVVEALISKAPREAEICHVGRGGVASWVLVVDKMQFPYAHCSLLQVVLGCGLNGYLFTKHLKKQGI